MDTPMPNAMPEQDLPVSKPVAAEPASSLIQEKKVTVTNRPPMGLWLVSIIALAGVGGLAYMFYSQQSVLNSYNTSLQMYQQNLHQWTDQVNTLQSALQDLRTQVPVATMLPTNSATPSATATTIPNFTLPTAVTGLGDDSDKNDDVVATPNTRATTNPSAIFDSNDTSSSLSDGKMTAEDEQTMLESYLQEVVAGQHKTAQPDGLAMFQSRQASSDGQLSYDIFKSTTLENTFYIYVRKGPATAPVGWYGPFSSFPSS